MKLRLPENVLTGLNLHIAGVVLLAALNLFLAARLALAWHNANAQRPEVVQEQQLAYKTLELQTAPLRGLSGKVEQARSDADKFYAQRIPATYSSIAAELGSLAVKNGIRLTRVQYTQTPALAGLAEIRMDASLSGEYPGLMRFINGLERDKSFFLISGLTLTGQQGGVVNLRLRVITYLRAADAVAVPVAEAK
ncbi:MAG TPA: GspMb/PilO family protein [Acidisarcina sp.]|nr:GspMb/PilO family protein [Acidisarcina sp.]